MTTALIRVVCPQTVPIVERLLSREHNIAILYLEEPRNSNNATGDNDTETQYPIRNLDDILSKLTHLFIVCLYKNVLRSLDWTMPLRKLKEVTVKATTVVALPEDIGSLVELKTLKLLFNRISRIPASVGRLLNLVRLSLIHNKLTELPESVGDLNDLQHLHFGNNPFGNFPSQVRSFQIGLAFSHLQTSENYVPLPISSKSAFRSHTISSAPLLSAPLHR
jgi:Leucine-rich repeat (LRR) protein